MNHPDLIVIKNIVKRLQDNVLKETEQILTLLKGLEKEDKIPETQEVVPPPTDPEPVEIVEIPQSPEDAQDEVKIMFSRMYEVLKEVADSEEYKDKSEIPYEALKNHFLKKYSNDKGKKLKNTRYPNRRDWLMGFCEEKENYLIVNRNNHIFVHILSRIEQKEKDTLFKYAKVDRDDDKRKQYKEERLKMYGF